MGDVYIFVKSDLWITTVYIIQWDFLATFTYMESPACARWRDLKDWERSGSKKVTWKVDSQETQQLDDLDDQTVAPRNFQK